jgi:ribonucleoside-diphosphate reductase alpha chain
MNNLLSDEERTMKSTISVVKRDGRRESLDINKIHIMVEEACEGLAGVSVSQIEMNADLQFRDGITTAEIQEILIRSASDLISLEKPNYQYAAARLLLYGLRKDVFGQFDYIPLINLVTKNVERGVYDAELLDYYTQDEWHQLDVWINHHRDLDFTYAGMRQVVDKYLVQDRSSGRIFETPQYMYMLIAATLFAQYPKDTRMSYVRKYYDAVSTFKINIPTPVMSGVRTPIRQFASCVLVDVDDTLPSIFNSSSAVGYYIAQRAGIGLNVGRIRAIGSKIRGGEVAHTGVIPFLKVFESVVRSCTQNGVRGGSATVHFPIWHREIQDVLVLKNNKGTEDNRVRRLDYSIQISKLFYERLLAGANITLFSPHDTPGLYEAFGNNDQFDALYTRYENDKTISKTSVPAMELFTNLLKERAETGRIYIMNIDHCNSHSSFQDSVKMSNLCQEITLPTDPIQTLDDSEGEIALCILSAINVGNLRELDDLKNLCDLAVRALDEIIDYQRYPVIAAELSTKARRSLGIGYIGLAHYLAKKNLHYRDVEAAQAVNRLTEAFQYYLIRSSVQLAREKGRCSKFDRTKYAQGILPVDTYKRDIDGFLGTDLHYDWEALRRDIKEHGMRHSTLSAQMPSESSSVASNETNGIEPPRAYISTKKSKKGPLKQIVPQYSSLKNHYTFLWDEGVNEGYIRIVAAMQKYFDQAISGNWSYNPKHYENNEVPMSVMFNDLLTTYKYGWKTSYYHNTYDSKGEDEDNITATVELVQPVSQEASIDGENCEACTI